MRDFIDIVESAGSTLYHGSRVEFDEGTILTPQADGYVTYPDAEAQHTLTERVLEDNRPQGCVSRFGAVFLIDNPELIDYAGGYTDFIYEVEPLGPVTRCNLAWYSELYSICEDAVLSESYSSETPEMVEAALHYWNADPRDSSDLYEYLTDRARVIRIID